MKGYVLNSSNRWLHAMKRSIGPGAKVPLSELFEQYGVKHNLSGGKEFIDWLRNTKLKGKDEWRIITEEDSTVIETIPTPKTTAVKNKKQTTDNVAPMVKSKMEVKDLVEMSVRQARETLPTIKDLNLLKYAFQEANQRAGKDSLCRIIRKRIKELQISR